MPNKIYRAIEDPVVFSDSDGNVVITLLNLAFGAGRVSARYDRGAGSKAKLHKVKAVIQFETPPILKEAVEIYIFESDGAYADGNIGTADAALISDKRNNAKPVGSVIVDTISTATNIIASWDDVPIGERYYSVGVWNASAGDNLKNTANACRIIVTPMPFEIQ